MAQHVSNINFRQRLTQTIVMVVIILAGMLFSQFAHAQKSITAIKYNAIKFNKAKHRSSIHKNSDMACYILHKKRTAVPNHPLIASSRRSKAKSVPMAETDAPKRLIASN